MLHGVVAQRLVRCLCRACREPYEPPPQLLERSASPRSPAAPCSIARVGCAACDGTGYRGRTAIAELLVLDERLRRSIVARADARGAARRGARRAAWSICAATGSRKAAAGITSLEEVLRVTGAA